MIKAALGWRANGRAPGPPPARCSEGAHEALQEAKGGGGLGVEGVPLLLGEGGEVAGQEEEVLDLGERAFGLAAEGREIGVAEASVTKGDGGGDPRGGATERAGEAEPLLARKGSRGVVDGEGFSR